MDLRPAQDYYTLASLPYDLLLAISQHLAYQDVLSLTQSCRSMREFIASRPVYRHLAQTFLRRCRPLPLSGFVRLSDLSNEGLIAAIHRAARLEHAWITRTPRPVKSLANAPASGRRWYRTLRSPPDEEVDWLSPITSSYILCSTKSGKVYCWDIETDRCLAVWDPHAQWELWKCRVEFDAREVYFTMAMVLDGSTTYENRRMEFVVMRLYFPPPEPGLDVPPPVFSALASFNTYGAVMNVFLLDPTGRVLSAFIWLANSNTIGLYALLDWNIREYVFIDTNVYCSHTGNWSCILYNGQIVIHTEDADAAEQFLYPLPLLREYSRPMPECPPPFSTPKDAKDAGEPFTPILSAKLDAPVRYKRGFVFPKKNHPNGTARPHDTERTIPRTSSLTHVDGNRDQPYDHTADDNYPLEGLVVPPPTVLQPFDADPPPPGVPTHPDNPYNWPWYPDSCHFVRQWWPMLPAGARMRRVSCTVVLLANHNVITHQTRYVLAQHYFGTPLGRDHVSAPADLSNHPGTPEHSPELMNGTARTNGVYTNGIHSVEEELDSRPRRPRPAPDKGKGKSKTTTEERLDLAEEPDGIPMRMWYINEPFEVVCVADPPPIGLGDNVHEEELEKERPLMAVDFGHAVWVEYTDDEPSVVDGPGEGALTHQEETNGADDNDSVYSYNTEYGLEAEDGEVQEQRRPKRLRFVSFPSIVVGEGGDEVGATERSCYGTVRTLVVPSELDLDLVDTVNIDQSQGAIILSVKEGRIFVLYYE